MYSLHVQDARGDSHFVGSVKIGQVGMVPSQRRPALEPTFDRLGDEFFSVGQDDTYYENLNELGPDLREKVLRGLGDMAFDPSRFKRAIAEKVTGVSLLRSVTRTTIQGQYSRLANGGVRLSRYEFSYSGPRRTRAKEPPVELSFIVEPESMPPTNIHVLIGRNGVGKTHLLNNMSRSLVEKGLKLRRLVHSRAMESRLK